MRERMRQIVKLFFPISFLLFSFPLPLRIQGTRSLAKGHRHYTKCAREREKKPAAVCHDWSNRGRMSASVNGIMTSVEYNSSSADYPYWGTIMREKRTLNTTAMSRVRLFLLSCRAADEYLGLFFYSSRGGEPCVIRINHNHALPLRAESAGTTWWVTQTRI